MDAVRSSSAAARLVSCSDVQRTTAPLFGDAGRVNIAADCDSGGVTVAPVIAMDIDANSEDLVDSGVIAAGMTGVCAAMSSTAFCCCSASAVLSQSPCRSGLMASMSAPPQGGWRCCDSPVVSVDMPVPEPRRVKYR